MSVTSPTGLRETKKARTREALHRAALELALELGPDQVTVDAIAARAEVSTRTFFNYFPSRESAMSVSDPEIADRLAEMLRSRPPEEPVDVALREVLTARVRELAQDTEVWKLRRRLAREHPRLTMTLMEVQQSLVRALVAAALEREGQDERTGLTTVVRVHAVVGAVAAALWQHSALGFRGDVLQRLDDAFAALAR
jgi:AcrR family transcriptional regulator